MGLVELLDFQQIMGFMITDKIDGDTSSSESTTSSNSVDVIFFFGGQLKVDNETNLVHVDTSGQ